MGGNKMNENYGAFEKAMKDDPELFEKIKAEIADLIENGEIGEFEALGQVASKYGYLNDMIRNYAEDQELDDSELRKAAGGVSHDGSDENHCGSKYWCDVWYFHDLMFGPDKAPDTKKTQCLGYYLCDHIFN